MATGILKDKRGRSTGSLGLVDDLLCAGLGGSLAGDHEIRLSFQQFVMPQAAAALDEEKGGELACDFSVGLIDQALGGVSTVGGAADDHAAFVDVRDDLEEFGEHGAEEGPHVLGILIPHDDITTGVLRIDFLEERHGGADKVLVPGHR